MIVKKGKTKKIKVIAIAGATASGKSAVAVELAERLNGEIISADSMAIYKGMDIGTDKPSKELRERIRHHLISIAEPTANFSVALFQKMARAAVDDITQRRKMPIIAGGSGLYLRAIIDPLEFPSGNIDTVTRAGLEARLKEEGPEVLYRELEQIDPVAAGRIEPNNSRRVIRALEVIYETGGLFSEKTSDWNKRESIYDLKMFGLGVSRETLYQRINHRVDGMFAEGMLEEATSLFEKEIAETPAQALGYKEAWMYLKGEIGHEEMISLVKKRTRNFAKRQLIWFRQEPRIVWLEVEEKSAEELAGELVLRVTEWQSGRVRG